MRNFACVLLLSAPSFLRADPGPLVLSSPAPAANWNQEAYPVGNGKLAAMVFGGVAADEIQFNEDTIWTGQPHYYENPRATPTNLASIRTSVFNHQALSTSQQTNFMSVPLRQAMYEPAGGLVLAFPHSASNYSRTLDLNTATASVRYDYDGVTYYRDVFASAPSNKVIVLRLTASQPSRISFTCTLTTPQPTNSLSAAGNDLVLNARVSVKPRPEYYAAGLTNAIEYVARVRVLAEGGTVTAGSNSLSVGDADAVTVLLSVASNFVKYDDLSANPAALCSNNVLAAASMTYGDLREAQLRDYQALFQRVVLDLGTTWKTNLSTGERLRGANEGDDPQLAALYFQMGRYLMIAGSRPGSQPLNLQGKWNDNINPSWESKMTLNINEEMNYWGAEACNLAECHLPLFDMIGDLSATGHRVAATHYSSEGWVVHHNTDLWRGAAPINSTDGIWPTGAAWLCQHLWWHYQYTGDTNFLANIAYPLMKSAARFFLDSLVAHPSYPGWRVTNPSHSPEHSQLTFNVSNVAGPTMDNQLIRDLFNHVLEAAEILGVDASFRTSVVTARDQLPPNRIGRLGQLQEWLEDSDGATDTHRHMSHLVALFPGDEITPFYTSSLAAAAKVSVEIRGDGGGSTGWDKAWKMCLRDRLLDGDRAHALLMFLFRSYVSTNMMFTDVANRQVDGTFGALMGVAEMFLQSQAGEVFLLPALPGTWTNGSISGLCARGGFQVDVQWQSNKLASANILSRLGNTCRVRAKWPIDVMRGTNYVDAAMVMPGLWQFSTLAGSNYAVVPALVAETESLSASTSTGDAHQVTTNLALSSLRGTRLDANAAADFVTYTVTNLSAGDYQLHVVADAGTNRARFQLSVGPSGGTLTNLGSVHDTYCRTNVVYLLATNSPPTNYLATNMLQEFACGTWHAASNGNYDFRFTVVDKHTNSSGYRLAFDYIKFTPVSTPASSNQRPRLTAIPQGRDIALSWPTNTTGYLLESTLHLSAVNWTSASPMPVVVGDLNVVSNAMAGEQTFYRLRRNF
jgi:alpha-L-fucosidase 2